MGHSLHGISLISRRPSSRPLSTDPEGITPAGWTHEQDNTKLTRGDDGRLERALVREFGLNEYRRIDDFDFQPAYDYWSATSEYWAEVRKIWAEYFDNRGGVSLDMPADGMPLIGALFELAREVEQGQAVAQSRIMDAFERHVQAAEPRRQALTH